MLKFFILIYLIAAKFNQLEARLTYEFAPEDGCSRVGGLCVHKTECDHGFRMNTDLCPSQSSNGAVCCSKVPSLWTDCSRRGGECVSRDYCPDFLTDELGKCEANYACCIFV